MPSHHPKTNPTGQFLDVFLSHASEDRADVASPLAEVLVALGYSVWISDHEIVPGNSLALRINDGLRSCRFGVAVLSTSYLPKIWTMKELAALTSREEAEQRSIIIPVLYDLTRIELTKHLPLWAPAVSVTWTGDAHRAAAEIARALGPPVLVHPEPLRAFALARALASGELDVRPHHEALIAGAGEAVTAIGEVWRAVQTANRGMPHGASEARKRARAMMLAQTLRAPIARLSARTEHLEAVASAYLMTHRKLLEMGSVVPVVDKATFVGLNEVMSGVVAATFSQFVSDFTFKRVQAATFPKRHPDLTRALDRVGDDLGRLSFAFETLVDFCLSEVPSRTRLILER